MGAKLFLRPESYCEPSTSGQSTQQTSSYESIQTADHVQPKQQKPVKVLQAIKVDLSKVNSSDLTQEFSDKEIRIILNKKPSHKSKEKLFTPLQSIEEDITDGNNQDLKETSSHGNVQDAKEESSHEDNRLKEGGSFCGNDQTVEEKSSRRNIQAALKRSFMTLHAIREDITHENYQALKEVSSHRNVQAREESSPTNDQSVQEESSSEEVQRAQEESSRKNDRVEEQGPCHENVQIVGEEESSRGNNQSAQEEFSHERIQTTLEKSSYENERDKEEGSSHENVQTVEEKESSRGNSQSAQEEFSHERVQTTLEKSSYENERDKAEGSSHENVQTVEEKESSRGNNQSAQEEFSHERIQTTLEKSSYENERDKEEGFSHENVQTVEESSRGNNQLIQEELTHEKVQPTLEKSSHENDQDEEQEFSRGNVQDADVGPPGTNNQSTHEQHLYSNVQRDKLSHQDDQSIEEGSSQNSDEINAQLQENESWRCFSWLQKISVEPTMWLYMMAFMFTSVVEQDFFLYKACRVDHGYPENVCRNLRDFRDVKTEVQKTVSEFQQWYNFAGHIVPIFLALFFGNWSDRRGRKLPLVIGLTGKLIYSLMIVINSQMENWNLNMVTYTAVIPMGVLGGDVMIFGSCFAYLTDICSFEERTIRITILDVVYLSTMPTGIALGSYIFANVVDSSYAIMFAINSCMLGLAIIYSLVRLKWQSAPEQESLAGVNFLKDFFDLKHVRETMKMMTKERPNNGRMCLILVMLSMCLYTFQRDERSMSYLYTQLVFKWNVTEFSNFRTFQSSLFVAAMLCAMPALKYFKLKDTVIAIIGATSHSLGRLAFIAANTGRVFYAGAVIAALGPVVAPAIRSMASKFVEVEERGKVFAILSVFDNAVPLISSVFYSQIYNATIYTVPNIIYWLTFITQVCVILISITIMYISSRRGLHTR